jgi:mRNA interferase RelE/StbE
MEKRWIVKISRNVLKDLDDINSSELPNIKIAINGLENNPFPVGVKKLKSQKQLILRIRVGKYRIIYNVDSKENSVIVLSVVHRKEADK